MRKALLLGALGYFVAFPVVYSYVGSMLECRRGFELGFGCRTVKRSPVQHARSAFALYQADNPGQCPTVEDLVLERYLLEEYAPVIEIRCEGGDVVILGPGASDAPLGEQQRRRACGRWRLVGKIWAAPMRGLAWIWRGVMGG